MEILAYSFFVWICEMADFHRAHAMVYIEIKQKFVEY